MPESDLIPEDITVPTLAQWASDFTVTWVITNQGDAVTDGEATTTVSISSSPTTPGPFAAGVLTQSLDPGESETESATLQAPVSPGAYYVWIDADPSGEVSNQSDTANDLQRSAAFTVPASDLVPEDITVPATVQWDTPFTVSWVVANQGAGNALGGSSTSVSISSSPTTPGPELTEVTNDEYFAGQTQAESATVVAPTTPGTYYVWIDADAHGEVGNQSDTANDLLRSAPFTVPASDLVPEDITVPATVQFGQTFTASWVIANQGAGNAIGGSSTAVYLSTSPSSPGDQILTEETNDEYLAGQTQAESATLTAPAAPGIYYLWLDADLGGEVANQSDTANDLQRSGPIIVPASDLIPENITVSPASVEADSPLQVSWTIANQGAGNALGGSSSYVTISSSPGSPGDQILTEVTNDEYLAGQTQAESATITAPTKPGTYYVWVDADGGGMVANQSDTTNDLQRSAAFTVRGSDLVPGDITLASPVVQAGAPLSLSWLIGNVGDGATLGSSTTYLTISSSAFAPGSDVLAKVPNGSYASGQTQTETATLTAPTTPGVYYVWVDADGAGTVLNQSDTANDAAPSAGFTVTAPPASDLTPVDVTLGGPLNVAPGASLPVSWLVLNQGSADANAASTSVVTITQSPLSAVGTTVASITTPALVAGEGQSQTATLTAPMTPGGYFVWVNVNGDGSVTNENGTTNDADHSLAFTVADPADSDLTVDQVALNIPSTVAPGASIPVSWLVTNQGAADANANSTSVVTITSSPDSPGGTELASVANGTLAAGGFDSESATIAAPSSPGLYYVWIDADADGDVTNQDDTLNDAVHSIAFTVAEPAPSDLTPADIILGFPATVAPGVPLPVSWLILNQGQGEAAAASNTSLTITSSVFSAAGPVLANVATPILEGGASQSQSATLTAPAQPGQYYVWIDADSQGAITNQNDVYDDKAHSIAFTVAKLPRHDFLGHGRSDVLIQNTDGAVVFGEVVAGAMTYSAATGLGPEWTFVGDGVFTPGQPGFLIENTAGAVVEGTWANGVVAFSLLGGLGPEWRFVGVGDFDGSGHDEVLIDNTQGDIFVGDASTGVLTYAEVAGLGPEWTFKGVGDYLGAGRDQFLIENTDGVIDVGSVSGAVTQYVEIGAVGPEWSILGSGDFLGAGYSQFLMENTAGALVIASADTGAAVYQTVGALGPEWRFVAFGAFIPDGRDQFMIENTSGAVVLGEISGASASYVQVGGLGPEWRFH